MLRKTRPVQKDCYACMEYNAHWFANDLEEPYTTPDDKPFSWQGRLRVIGGRTNVWGRQSYRLSDLDFKAKSHDGYDDGLADQLRRPGARTTTSSRSTSGFRARPKASPSCPTGNFQPRDADDVRRDAAPHAREGRSSDAPSRSAARPT